MFNFLSIIKFNSKAKCFFVGVMSIFFLSASCSKQNMTTAQTVAIIPEVDVAASVEQKVLDVKASLSRRAQQAMTIANMADFLRDLEKVLAADEAHQVGGDISLLYLADKTHYLPDGYEPKDIVPLAVNADFQINRNDLSLRREAYEALVQLARGAKADGITLLASSSYRSYEYQIKVYNKWVEIEGQEEADRISARPGTSQHQLGTVIDFGSIDNTFAETRAGKWMVENAGKYGWSLSFPDGYEDVTGYDWESWHYRYIGLEACNFQKKYFGDIQQFMIEFIDAWKRSQNS